LPRYGEQDVTIVVPDQRWVVKRRCACHGGDIEKYLGEVNNLSAPLLMYLAEEDEFISKPAQAAIKTALAAKRSPKRGRANSTSTTAVSSSWAGFRHPLLIGKPGKMPLGFKPED